MPLYFLRAITLDVDISGRIQGSVPIRGSDTQNIYSPPIMSDKSDTLPPLQIYLHQKNYVKVFCAADSHAWSASNAVESTEIAINQLSVPPFCSRNGKFVCYVSNATSTVRIFKCTDNSEVMKINCSDIQYAEFSPKGTYLLTHSRVNKQSTEGGESSQGNLRIWSVETGDLLAQYHQRVMKTDIVQWSYDEQICTKIVTNEVHIMNGRNLGAGIVAKVHCKGVTQYKISCSHALNTDNTFQYFDVAGIVPPIKMKCNPVGDHATS